MYKVIERGDYDIIDYVFKKMGPKQEYLTHCINIGAYNVLNIFINTYGMKPTVNELYIILKLSSIEFNHITTLLCLLESNIVCKPNNFWISLYYFINKHGLPENNIKDLLKSANYINIDDIRIFPLNFQKDFNLIKFTPYKFKDLDIITFFDMEDINNIGYILDVLGYFPFSNERYIPEQIITRCKKLSS